MTGFCPYCDAQTILKAGLHDAIVYCKNCGEIGVIVYEEENKS